MEAVVGSNKSGGDHIESEGGVFFVPTVAFELIRRIKSAIDRNNDLPHHPNKTKKDGVGYIFADFDFLPDRIIPGYNSPVVTDMDLVDHSDYKNLNLEPSSAPTRVAATTLSPKVVFFSFRPLRLSSSVG